MRLLPALFFAGSVGMIAAACGGSSDQDVLSASSSSSSTSASSSGTTASSSSGATSSSGTSTSGSTSGTPSTTDASTDPPPGACTDETELNNEPGDANELETSVCGTLLPVTEVDFLTFKLPSNTKGMNLTFTGNVKLKIFIDGQESVELSPSSNPQIPVSPGKEYFVRVSAHSAAAKIDWRVNLQVST